MPSRAQTDALVRAQAVLASRVSEDLAGIVAALGPDAAPDLIRDALLEVTPALVERYGQASAAVAAEWYERVYGLAAREFADVVASEVVEKGVRRSAGHLFTARGAEGALVSLEKSLDAWVKAPGRQTLMRSAMRDGLRFARVPSGRHTCAFCLMLASRGAVYKSETAAGRMDKFHGKCDCVIAPVRDEKDYPAGYHPDELYEAYATALDRVSKDARLSEARDAERARLEAEGYKAGDVNARLTLWAIRAAYPGLVSDGHKH